MSRTAMLKSKRTIILIVLVVLIPIGLGTKFYHGPGQEWVYEYAGDILYTMFFFFLLRLIWLWSNPIGLAVAAFCFSTTIEFTQLISTPFLETIRSTFLGRTFIGTGFTPVDIVYYLLGSTLGLIILRILEKDSAKESTHN